MTVSHLKVSALYYSTTTICYSTSVELTVCAPRGPRVASTLILTLSLDFKLQAILYITHYQALAIKFPFPSLSCMRRPSQDDFPVFLFVLPFLCSSCMYHSSHLAGNYWNQLWVAPPLGPTTAANPWLPLQPWTHAMAISIYTKNFQDLYKLKSWESDWAKKLGPIFDKFCANLSADVPTLVNFIQSCWGVIVLYRSANCRPTFYSNAVV